MVTHPSIAQANSCLTSLIWPLNVTVHSCLYYASLRHLTGGPFYPFVKKVHCSTILVMANNCTIQVWSKSKVSEREWSDQWSEATISLGNTEMGDHLTSIIFFRVPEILDKLSKLSSLPNLFELQKNSLHMDPMNRLCPGCALNHKPLSCRVDELSIRPELSWDIRCPFMVPNMSVTKLKMYTMCTQFNMGCTN